MKLLSTILIILFSISAIAEIKLPSLVSDNMVLQRNTSLKLWGWSNPGESINISTSWNKKSYTTKGNSKSKWSVYVSTPEAGGPYQITFSGSESQQIVLSDILIGEVWVCSGQSNMQWSSVNGYDNSEAEVAAANFTNIRLFQVPNITAEMPQENCSGSWAQCTPESVRAFSAVGYFFGLNLHKNLDIPIGLINTSWGGTPAEAWIPKEYITKNKEFSLSTQNLQTSSNWFSKPGVLYNAMIHPLTNFSIAGAIWYQGESNAANPFVYRNLFPAMINSWRNTWGQEFPFYYVQIAPYNYAGSMKGALVREAQLLSLKTPKTGMVVISDIGNINDIHPRNKVDVGSRLANWALNKSYGQKDISYSGPIYKSYIIDGTKVKIEFEHNSGLKARGGDLTHFEIAGEDQIFYTGEAEIENDAVWVSSPKVPTPAAVRFAFSNTAEPNLFNEAELPASMFRTDDWSLLLEEAKIKTKFDNDKKQFIVTISTKENHPIRYTTDGSSPDLKSNLYTDPFMVSNSILIKARPFINNKPSQSISQTEIVYNKTTFKKITLQHKYSDQYPAGGDLALVDGRKGSAKFNDGIWQGYQDENLEILIDLEKKESFSSVKVGFLSDQGVWIFYPGSMEVQTSKNGKKFKSISQESIEITKLNGVHFSSFGYNGKKIKSRFIKLIAKPIKLPEWHTGAGSNAWIFADEILIE
jgi:sialate O-acetylesterase